MMVGRYPLDERRQRPKIWRNFPFNYPGESSIKINVIHPLLLFLLQLRRPQWMFDYKFSNFDKNVNVDVLNYLNSIK